MLESDVLEPMALDGELAPPMANGELIFEYPWQGRVFGMASALCQQGCYEWDEFRGQLIHQLAGATSPDFEYYEHFLAALSALLEDKGICSSGLLEARKTELAARPHGHDH